MMRILVVLMLGSVGLRLYDGDPPLGVSEVEESNGETSVPNPTCNGRVVPATQGDNGVWYAWASPCSGGCSRATPICDWGLYSEEDWKGLPRAEMKKTQKCASTIFDKRHGHCDKQDAFVRAYNGGNNE